ncbi:hypothetical protein HK099_008333 [Clydaea vesicula]|uniref:RING-type domain-containing protein n=1 Tax=Clydaea vesicula TaxID=447962 RepID=A0AAD5U4S1_9FUNG|nr:hypothetical protein HK099_008333 [Clydaea vesicula]
MDFNSKDVEQGYDNLDYLYSRCSICFDETHDFCLTRCRDQFCKGCFQRYVREIVKSSWGLAIKEITCPVCNDALVGQEWKRYLDEKTIELYELYNQPHRAMSRYCGDCFIEIRIAQKPIKSSEERQFRFSEIYRLICNLFNEYKSKNKDSNCLARFQADFCNEFSGGGNGTKSILDIYTNIMIDVGKLVGVRCSDNGAFKEGAVLTLNPDLLQKVTLISTMFIPLETDEAKWKKLQFLHISNFPKVIGETPFHENLACTKYMKNIIARNEDTEKVANFKWKLENRCELDRTRSKIQLAEEKELLSTSPSKTKAFTELGVPNVFQIEEKFLK